MDNDVKEAVWLIAGLLILTGGVALWLGILYWNERIKKVVERIESIVDFVDDQEQLNKL